MSDPSRADLEFIEDAQQRLEAEFLCEDWELMQEYEWQDFRHYKAAQAAAAPSNFVAAHLPGDDAELDTAAREIEQTAVPMIVPRSA
jgi:hypothetical protein